jgi:DNA-directed RNA polymerase subunit N (RpoN/RPB10)
MIQYPNVRCTRCGKLVAANWLVRHRKAGCNVAVVEPPDPIDDDDDTCGGKYPHGWDSYETEIRP